MHRARLASRLMVCALALVPGPALAGSSKSPAHDQIAPLLGDNERARHAAQTKLVRAGARGLVPGLVDALFFTPKRHRTEIVAALQALTRHDAGADYYGWVEWLGGRTDFEPAPGYVAWKSELFGRIDPTYREIFDPKSKAKLRVEEIVFGGARFGGIPALDDPPHVAAAGATELGSDELVFGVALGGEARAYPHRFLSWHEMANDVVGGEPITLSY